MKSKKILFYLPTIILLIYVIAYYPLLTCLMNTLVNPSASPDAMVAPFQVNDIMDKISICIVLLSIILKVIFRKEKCNIDKIPSVVNLTIFVVLIVLIFFLGTLTAFA